MNEKWRIEAARNKLETIKLQSDILNPSIIIPFASFIYFANEENFYLNDHSNKINSLIDYNNKYGLNFVIMKPYETQVLEQISKSKDLKLIGKNKIKDKNRAPTISFTSKSKNSKEISDILVSENIATRNDNFYAWRCLKALGIDTEDGLVRLSMVHYNNNDDVMRLLKALNKI